MDLSVSTVLVFICGSILGSFLNVVIYRLPRGLSIVRPGSSCPHCHTPIRARDNIPLASFLILRGRCRACGAPISWRYPLVEAASGGLLAGVWIRFAPAGAWVPLVAMALFSLMLVVVFFIDLDHQIVPNAITYPGLVAGLLFAIPQGRLVPSALVAVGAGAVFLMIAVVSGGGMGGGDIKHARVEGGLPGGAAYTVGVLSACVDRVEARGPFHAVTRAERKTPPS